jgi:hypothetical protein
MELKFNRTGTERKQLVGAISEILNQPIQYLGAPTFAYEVGGYHIDKEGTITWDERTDSATMRVLLTQLSERGYEADGMAAFLAEPEAEAAAPELDEVVIEMPLDGFTPEALDNLTKMVLAKEVLLKKALGMDDLPIQVLADRIAFPWFRLTKDNGEIAAYSQFIAALCMTAKEKKRVTAKAQETFENEKFALRYAKQVIM